MAALRSTLLHASNCRDTIANIDALVQVAAADKLIPEEGAREREETMRLDPRPSRRKQRPVAIAR